MVATAFSVQGTQGSRVDTGVQPWTRRLGVRSELDPPPAGGPPPGAGRAHCAAAPSHLNGRTAGRRSAPSGGGVVLVYLALMLLMPFAPLPSGHPPLRWMPARCRAFMEFLRTKFHLATG